MMIYTIFNIYFRYFKLFDIYDDINFYNCYIICNYRINYALRIYIDIYIYDIFFFKHFIITKLLTIRFFLKI